MKRLAILPVLIALQPAAATATPSADLQTGARYQFSVTTNTIDAYNSQDGNQSSSGTGTYAITPSQSASAGVGATSAGGSGHVEWTSSVAPPPNSMATMDGAWFSNKDADGNDLPILHLSNLTEFAVPVQIQLHYELYAMGAAFGDAGVSAFNQVGFHIYCNSCTGLTFTDFGDSQLLLAGGFYGGADGAFNDTKTDTVTASFSLNRFSSFGLFIGARSSATLIANAAAVPEPATWAMLVAGFAIVGGTLRRSGLRERFA